MNMTQDDDVPNRIAQTIARYLTSHPNAADTVDGIAKYWLAEIEETADMFRIAHIQLALVQRDDIVAIISKATNGASGIDATYTKFKQAARGLNCPWGSYNFGTGDDIHAQLDNKLPQDGESRAWRPGVPGLRTQSSRLQHEPQPSVGLRGPVPPSGRPVRRALCRSRAQGNAERPSRFGVGLLRAVAGPVRPGAGPAAGLGPLHLVAIHRWQRRPDAARCRWRRHVRSQPVRGLGR
ncbi:hypothetical protein DID96_12400 [Burkholderia sp. Bp8963]|nr:hypothetical protein DID96_12400 [Burkholderia sp. Bp8963]